MRGILIILASAILLAALLPSAGATGDVCHGQRVGWEGYQETCIHPTDPSCIVEYRFVNIGEEWRYCTGV